MTFERELFPAIFSDKTIFSDKLFGLKNTNNAYLIKRLNKWTEYSTIDETLVYSFALYFEKKYGSLITLGLANLLEKNRNNFFLEDWKIELKKRANLLLRKKLTTLMMILTIIILVTFIYPKFLPLFIENLLAISVIILAVLYVFSNKVICFYSWIYLNIWVWFYSVIK